MRGNGAYEPRSGFCADYRRFYDLDLGQRFFEVEAGAERLAAQVFEPTGEPRGAALVVHGYYDHVGLYGHLIRYLLSRGLTVLAYDQQGHGLSTGERATIDSFDRYVDGLETVLARLLGELPAPRYALAQSMGGAVLMEHLMRPAARDFDETVLFAPLIRPRGWKLGKLTYLAARRFLKHVRRGPAKHSEDRDFIEFLKVDPLQTWVLPVQWIGAMAAWMERFESYRRNGRRVVVLQGGRDGTVDGPYNVDVLRRLFEVELFEIPQARHHLVNEAAAIRERMWRFLDGHLHGDALAAAPDHPTNSPQWTNSPQ